MVACFFLLLCHVAEVTGAERTWRNPITDGTAIISVDWFSLIDAEPEGVLFTFRHFKNDTEVALAVDSGPLSSATDYGRELPNRLSYRLGKPLWEFTREESGRDVYYAAFNFTGDGNEWPPSYLEIRVWRDSKGAFWTLGIRCAPYEPKLAVEARQLVDALEGTVTNPREPAEDPTLEGELSST